MIGRLLTFAGWLGTVLVAVAVGRFAAIDPRWDAFLVWAAVAGLACLVIHVVGGRRDWMRRAAAPADPGPPPMATLASAAAIGLVLTSLADRYSTRWDVTADRIYQLAPETRAALRALDAPVRVRLPARQADLAAHRDRLTEYEAASRHVTIDYLDLDAQPALVTRDDVPEDGTARLEYKGRAERVAASSEQAFTNALLRLREGRTRKVYFTTGHAERDVASPERAGYSHVAETLRRLNFVVEKLHVAEQEQVPPDASLVIVAGPRADFFPAEIDVLRRYAGRGGAMLLMVDPFEDLKRYITESGLALFMLDPASVSSTGELRNLTAFVRDLGVELVGDVVVDGSEMGKYLGTDASVPVAGNYPAHAITEGLTALSTYPVARSVRVVPGVAGAAASFIETGDQSWSETDVRQLGAGRLSMDPERGDRPGPVSLGVARSLPSASPPPGGASPSRETRLVVVGDSDFVANYSANISGNAQMFTSIVRWLAQEREVTIPARMPQQRVLTMTAAARRNVFWLSVLLLPGLAFGMGIYLWGRAGR